MNGNRRIVGRLGDAPLLEAPAGDMRDTVLVSDDSGATSLSAGLVWVAPGETIHEDVHTFDEAYYVIAGQATVIVDGERHVMTADDVVFIPAGARHKIENDGDGVFQIFWCIASRWSDMPNVVKELATWPVVDPETGWHLS